MAFLKKNYSDLTDEQKLKLRALIPLGTTTNAIFSVESLNPPDNHTGTKPLHHASVSYLMSLGFSWQNAVQLATSRT